MISDVHLKGYYSIDTKYSDPSCVRFYLDENEQNSIFKDSVAAKTTLNMRDYLTKKFRWCEISYYNIKKKEQKTIWLNVSSLQKHWKIQGSSNEEIIEKITNYYLSLQKHIQQSSTIIKNSSILKEIHLREINTEIFVNYKNHIRQSLLDNKRLIQEDLEKIEKICSFGGSFLPPDIEGSSTTSLRLIGSGSSKKVWLCADIKANKVVSFLKTCLSDKGESEQYLAKREHFFLKYINNGPGVVKTYGVIYFDQDNKLYQGIYQHHYNHGALFDCIFSGLTEEKIIKIFRDVLKGLTYLHRLRVIHRDIKPENILVTGNIKAVISDFEFAVFNVQEELAIRSKIVGSPKYLAPEIIIQLQRDVLRSYCKDNTFPQTSEKVKNSFFKDLDSKPRFLQDEACDVWAMGLTLFALDKRGQIPRFTELLTQDFDGALRLIKEDQFMPIPENKNTKDYIIWTMLRPEPQERITAEKALELFNKLYPDDKSID